MSELRDRVLDLAKAGLPYAQITAETGVCRSTIKTWIRRGGLSKPPAMLKLEQAEARLEALERSIADASKLVRHHLSDHLVKSAQVVANQPAPRSMKQVREHQEAISPLVSNAKAVFGWADDQHRPAINLALLSTPMLPPAIDVPSTVTPTDKHA